MQTLIKDFILKRGGSLHAQDCEAIDTLAGLLAGGGEPQAPATKRGRKPKSEAGPVDPAPSVDPLSDPAPAADPPVDPDSSAEENAAPPAENAEPK